MDFFKIKLCIYVILYKYKNIKEELKDIALRRLTLTKLYFTAQTQPFKYIFCDVET